MRTLHRSVTVTTTRARAVLGCALALTLGAELAGCGSDDDGTGGAGGNAGKQGTAGAGGKPASGGRGGASSGKGGASNATGGVSAGHAGTHAATGGASNAGAPVAGGNGGAGNASGTSGASATGGVAGTISVGGSGVVETGGSAGQGGEAGEAGAAGAAGAESGAGGMSAAGTSGLAGSGGLGGSSGASGGLGGSSGASGGLGGSSGASGGLGGSSGASASPPSCAGMVGNECQGGDCCASPLVPGGTFTQGKGQSDAFQSTVSSFRLDKYEATVGRFRHFVADYDVWRTAGNPVAGAGANPHIASSGWDSDYTSLLPANAAALKAQLSCQTDYTWADAGNDTLPMNCVNWYLGYAFCIWDGGRLPTDSEWEYAAAGGGTVNAPYPWGETPVPNTQQDNVKAYANYSCWGDGVYDHTLATCTFSDILPVGSKPAGDGLFGHADLLGSMSEWVRDWYNSYPTGPQTDYAWLVRGSVNNGHTRSGTWLASLTDVTVRNLTSGTNTNRGGGTRCARSP